MLLVSGIIGITYIRDHIGDHEVADTWRYLGRFRRPPLRHKSLAGHNLALIPPHLGLIRLSRLPTQRVFIPARTFSETRKRSELTISFRKKLLRLLSPTLMLHATSADGIRWRARGWHLCYCRHVPPALLLAKLERATSIKVIGTSIVHELTAMPKRHILTRVAVGAGSKLAWRAAHGRRDG